MHGGPDHHGIQVDLGLCIGRVSMDPLQITPKNVEGMQRVFDESHFFCRLWPWRAEHQSILQRPLQRKLQVARTKATEILVRFLLPFTVVKKACEILKALSDHFCQEVIPRCKVFVGCLVRDTQTSRNFSQAESLDTMFCNGLAGRLEASSLEASWIFFGVVHVEGVLNHVQCFWAMTLVHHRQCWIIALRMVMPTQASPITKSCRIADGVFSAKRHLQVRGEPKDLAALTKHAASRPGRDSVLDEHTPLIMMCEFCTFIASATSE